MWLMHKILIAQVRDRSVQIGVNCQDSANPDPTMGLAEDGNNSHLRSPSLKDQRVAVWSKSRGSSLRLFALTPLYIYIYIYDCKGYHLIVQMFVYSSNP